MVQTPRKIGFAQLAICWVIGLTAGCGSAGNDTRFGPGGDDRDENPMNANDSDGVGVGVDVDDLGGGEVTVSEKDGGNCGITTNDTQRLAPDILLVLDRSGSMVEHNAEGCVNRVCGTRWQEVTTALGKVLKATEVGINWGLKYYPDDDWCGVNAGANVGIKSGNADPIISAYTARPPIEGKTHTPTREAVQKAAQYLKGLTTPNPKVMLLATDGEPNCMAGWSSDSSAGQRDSQPSIDAVAAAAATGIPVYVVGVATSKTSTTDTLNNMARAGGTALDNPLLAYYAVDTSEDLEKAMQAISVQAASCTFRLAEEPPLVENIAVEADGTRLPKDAANGWQYGADLQTIELFGSACSAVKSGDVKAVKILFGCPGEPIK